MIDINLLLTIAAGILVARFIQAFFYFTMMKLFPRRYSSSSGLISGSAKGNGGISTRTDSDSNNLAQKDL